MKAVVLNGYGGSEVLQLTEREVPRIKHDEVLIKVYAAGINRPDIFQRKGNYPAPAGTVADILGLEVAGQIVEVGDTVKDWKVGDEVCALVPGGGYAEYVNAHTGSCLPIPKGMETMDAAALPETLFTVWHNVFQLGGLQKGETVLVYGGSGGIGSMTIQLGHLYGSRVVATASSPEKIEFCRKLNASQVVNYKEEDVLDVLGKRSVDVILDSIGGDSLDRNLDLLKEEGRLVYINAMEGGKPTLNIFKVMSKRLHLTGSTMRARDNGFKSALAETIYKEAYPLLENKSYINLVNHRFPVEKVREAHDLMNSRDFFGKIILCF